MRRITPVIMLLAGTLLLGAGPAASLHHSITISLFPPDNSLLATDSIRVGFDETDGGALKFLINKSLMVEDIASDAGIVRWHTLEDFEPSTFVEEPDSEDLELLETAKAIFIELGDRGANDASAGAGTESAGMPSGTESAGPAEITLAITYSGVLYDSLQAPPAAYARGFAETSGLIDERGVYLSNGSLWYPFDYDRMFTFDLTVDVPFGWMAISQGRRADQYTGRLRDKERTFTVWIEEHPTPELYLVAGDYYRHEAYHQGVWVMTYTYEQSDSLAQVYLDATGRYIALYDSLIGEYPFSKFAMVENFWQTGYGMPSFTLLGDKVIRLPFIVRTSYGHEILHNWWGNSVFVDYSKGNWCEGLTTYGADYLYKEQMSEDEARDYRHHTLISFNNYVTEGKDLPLTEFRERHDAASQNVGYGKSLMVYHMLRRSLGDSIFWHALRDFYETAKFTVATWDDVESAFSRAAGEDLSWYFDQWIERTGMPAISLEGASYEAADGGYEVTVRLMQEEPAWQVDLPVRIETAQGTESHLVHLAGPESTYTFPVVSEPVRVAVDPDYDTFRKLYIEEIPLTLGSMFGQDSPVVVIGNRESDSTRAGLRDVAAAWGLAAHVVDEADFDRSRLGTDYVWLMGRGDLLNRLAGPEAATAERGKAAEDGNAVEGGKLAIGAASIRVAGEDFPMPGNTLVCALRNPDHEELGLGIVVSDDVTTLKSLARRIPHYSKYSYLGFTGSRPALTGVWPERKSPMVVDFRGK
ncbi:MAG: M1 family aminopeptidase [bacterium]|jgi:hypothetical protein